MGTVRPAVWSRAHRCGWSQGDEHHRDDRQSKSDPPVLLEGIAAQW